MANPKLLFDFIRKWEGGWADHKADKGGKTNMGITLSTWRSCGYDKDSDGDIDADDLKLITLDDVYNVFKKHYWDRWMADHIKSQSLANILVDWVWASGSYGIKIPQNLLQIQCDGIVGMVTLQTLNQTNAREFFQVIKEARLKFIDDICRKDPSQEVFRKGWTNRINDIKFVG
ncbi:glycoside hydrolase family 108 protein [Bacteroides caecigallinarum]|uniref:glycoside hydrolase family 108 protein n=1 Tax=Bacteroides caecigallinarum TaxID=1411144 RepID=UPI001F204920|nr:glycosyl hydrolase 108 family protein [Bacteroides caecigallinarum]MCF2553168.1 peptidoglycan domain protein [Bacteroides caecigallinarum]